MTILQSLVIIDLWEEEIYHRPVKFFGNRLCGIGDIKLLNCHLTSREYVVRGPCDIMDEFPSS